MLCYEKIVFVSKSVSFRSWGAKYELLYQKRGSLKRFTYSGLYKITQIVSLLCHLWSAAVDNAATRLLRHRNSSRLMWRCSWDVLIEKDYPGTAVEECRGTQVKFLWIFVPPVLFHCGAAACPARYKVLLPLGCILSRFI